MATYNGIDYLGAQVASLISQQGVKVEIDVLDDGSTDGTYELLERLLLDSQIHSLQRSSRIGSSAAFMQLLSISEPADFYAFSDQDDIWLKTKLFKQVQCFDEVMPTLVISDRSLISSKGEPLKKNLKKRPQPSWKNSLVQNIAYGNTQVMNQALVDIIRKNSKNVKHYDAWTNLLASLYGRVVKVDEDLVQYRIHDQNLVGLGKRNKTNVIESIKDFRNQVKMVSRNSQDLSVEKRLEIKKYLLVFESRSIFSRTFHSFTCRAKRISKLETFAWKIFAPLIANN